MWSSSLKNNHCHNHRGNSEFYEKLEQLPPFFSGCRRASRLAEARGLRTAAGRFNLDFQRLALDQRPCQCGGAVFRPSGSLPGGQKSKTDPETVTVNQLPVGEDICVLFSHIHPGMGWPWISGPETELVDKSVFRLNRTFLWGSMLFKEPSAFLGT